MIVVTYSRDFNSSGYGNVYGEGSAYGKNSFQQGDYIPIGGSGNGRGNSFGKGYSPNDGNGHEPLKL